MKLNPKFEKYIFENCFQIIPKGDIDYYCCYLNFDHN